MQITNSRFTFRHCLAKAFALCALLISTSTLADIQVPNNPEKTDFYLLTTGYGKDLYTRFGHTAIRVVNRSEGLDEVFNWGMFDFSDPIVFGFNFYKGILIYKLATAPFSRTLAIYRNYENRSVWINKINLTPEQKRDLLNRMFWNLKPENVNYPYHFFFNNCSTKIRDHFDDVLKGKLRATYEPVSAGAATYRDHVRWHLSTIPFVVVGLDITMNSLIDRTLSKWEEMFLPLKLRDHLAALPAFDNKGQAIPGEKFLEPGKQIIFAKEVPMKDMNYGYYFLLIVFAAPILISFINLGLKGFWQKQKELNRSLRFLGLLVLAWFFASGLVGLLSLSNWLISAHEMLHHNANLLIFWPIDWLILPIGWSLFWKGQINELTRRWKNFLQVFSIGHLFTLVLLGLGRILGVVTQDTDRVFLFLGLTMALLLCQLTCINLKSRAIK